MRIQPNFQAVRFNGSSSRTQQSKTDALDSAAVWAADSPRKSQTIPDSASVDQLNLQQRARVSEDSKRESTDLAASSSAVWGKSETTAGIVDPEISSQHRKSSESAQSSVNQGEKEAPQKWRASDSERVAELLAKFEAPSFPVTTKEDLAVVESHRKGASGRMRDDLVPKRAKLEQSIRRTFREMALKALEYGWLADKNDILRYGGVESPQGLNEALTIKHPIDEFADLELQKFIQDGIQRIRLFSMMRKKDYVLLMGKLSGLQPEPKNLRLQRLRKDITGAEAEQIEKNEARQFQLKADIQRLRDNQLKRLLEQLEDTVEGIRFTQEAVLKQVQKK